MSENHVTRSSDPLLFMRTNPVGSLACLKEQAAGASKAIRTLSEPLFFGFIGGEVKPDNVDIVRVEDEKGDWQIGLIDLDDGGWGSLLVDLLHTLAYNKLWAPSVPWADALIAYRSGLRGKELKNVPTLKEILGDKRPSKESFSKAQRDWNEDVEDKKIRALAESPPEVEKLYRQDRDGFESRLKWLDLTVEKRGYERKEESGGSMCAVRFDYLVRAKVDGRDGVVEFKHQPDWPGPAALVFDKHADHLDRIKSLIEYYRPRAADNEERDKGNLIEVVRGCSGAYYIARYAGSALYKARSDKNVDDKQRKKAEAYTKRMLFWLGTVHAQQNSGVYAKAFIEATGDGPGGDDTLHELELIVDAHVRYLERLAAKSTRAPAFACSD